MIGHIRNSATLFDTECERFFQRCRNYRSESRKGSVLVVDDKNEIADFLSFLVEHCKLKINVVHIQDAASIGDVLNKLGGKGVKAVIIDSHILNTSATAVWMDSHYPNVPIFIANCEPDKVRSVKKTVRRAGFLSSKDGFTEYVDALGLPEECRDMAVSYSG